jgi:hypothetical protein
MTMQPELTVAAYRRLRGRDAGGATPPAARQSLRRWQIARCGDGNRK